MPGPFDNVPEWADHYREFWAESYERAADVATREQHLRELRIARDVQERLFPQHHPVIPGLEYAGACRSALEVGGDYYDFFPVSEADFGVAIGDVSGKGIAAALLMATLRAYLRGHTAGRDCDIPSLMAHLNQFVFESSDANRYATFFYAQYNTSTRMLSYTNGGHNPPLLFRAAPPARSVDPVRLQTGGAVIGLLPDCAYQQDQIRFGAGDLLVAFTDGITEATNAAGDEWGEERLIGAIRALRSDSAEALITRVMAAVDEFVADAAQSDDMTMSVVRGV
jgi:phosphoserine phosphatase RsbU/P